MEIEFTDEQKRKIFEELQREYLQENVEDLIVKYIKSLDVDQKYKSSLLIYFNNVLGEIVGDIKADVNFNNLFVAHGDIIMTHIKRFTHKHLSKFKGVILNEIN